jgi:hypothetical protein
MLEEINSSYLNGRIFIIFLFLSKVYAYLIFL